MDGWNAGVRLTSPRKSMSRVRGESHTYVHRRDPDAVVTMWVLLDGVTDEQGVIVLPPGLHPLREFVKRER